MVADRDLRVLMLRLRKVEDKANVFRAKELLRGHRVVPVYRWGDEARLVSFAITICPCPLNVMT